MKNLAGVHCDAEVLTELAEAGILAAPSSVPQKNREPVTRWGGALNGWTFERAWYYWRANGPELPRDVALALHEAHGSEVRTAGYAGGCPPYAFNEGTYPRPDSYHIDSAEGLRALVDVIRALPTAVAAPTGTVADIPDEKLLERAVRGAGRNAPRQVRWAHVMDRFALGSTYAAQLCRRFGLDPDEEVGVDEEPEEEEEDLDVPVVGECLLSEAAAAACVIGTTASQFVDERFVTVTKQGPDAWETDSAWCIPDAGMVGAKVLSMPAVSAAGVPLLPLVGSVNADSVTVVLGNVETIDMGKL